MKEDNLPAYIPPYYRAWLLLSKLRKSLKRRQAPFLRRARSNEEAPVCPAGKEHLLELVKTAEPNAINKTAFHYKEDLALPNVAGVVSEIEALEKLLDIDKLRYSNFAGNFSPADYRADSQERKMWEMTWLILNSGVTVGSSVLDVGGASTPFSFYLANKGNKVRVIDNDWGDNGLVYNANYIARKMNWNLAAVNRDAASRLPYEDGSFDFVFSLCVLEHLDPHARRSVIREIARVMRSGATAAMTFDYDAARDDESQDKGLRFSDINTINRDIIMPSGLRPYGNSKVYDDYGEKEFLGALFLRKI